MQAKTEITIEAGDWSSHIDRPSQLVTFTGKITINVDEGTIA